MPANSRWDLIRRLRVKLPKFFHRGSVPIFTLKILLWEGQEGEAWEVSHKPLVSDIGGALDIKVTSCFLDFKAWPIPLWALVTAFVYNLVIYWCKRLLYVVKYMVRFQRLAHLTSCSASLVRYSNNTETGPNDERWNIQSCIVTQILSPYAKQQTWDTKQRI